MTPAVNRALTITDNIGGDKASNNDPKAVIYQFDDNAFPNIPLIQPRLNSVEEWLITNFNNDAHPLHIHVNDFQVVSVKAKRLPGVSSGPEGVEDVAPAAIDPADTVLMPPRSTVMLLTRPTDFTGRFVFHCHMTFHEDHGMMGVVKVVPRS